MGNLTETQTWQPVPYFEENAVLTGGPDCPDNIPIQALANRDAYLKQQHDAHVAAADPHPQYTTQAENDAAIAAAVAALVNSSPTTLDTLKELATALGNDANFATTMTNALALKAPLASPALTGTPTAPTQPQFDNSTKLSTTEFVVKSGLRFSPPGVISVNTSTTLTTAHVGSVVELNAAGIITTLPAVASIPAGCAITFKVNYSSTLKGNTAELIFNQFGNANTLAVTRGEALTLVSTGGSWYVAANGFGSQSFSASLTASGYQTLPGGVILQWREVGVVASSGPTNGFYYGQATANFPVAFPTACLWAGATPRDTSGIEGGAAVTSYNANSATVVTQTTASGAAAYASLFGIGY